MKLVLIPKANMPDLYEVDSAVKEGLTFRPVSTLEEVLRTALLPAPKKLKAEKASPQGTEHLAQTPPPENTKPALGLRQ